MWRVGGLRLVYPESRAATAADCRCIMTITHKEIISRFINLSVNTTLLPASITLQATDSVRGQRKPLQMSRPDALRSALIIEHLHCAIVFIWMEALPWFMRGCRLQHFDCFWTLSHFGFWCWWIRVTSWSWFESLSQVALLSPSWRTVKDVHGSLYKTLTTVKTTHSKHQMFVIKWSLRSEPIAEDLNL